MLLCFYARQGMEGGFPVLLKGKWPVRRALRTWQIQNTPPSCQKKELNVPPKACCAVGVITAKPECISALACRQARLRAHISGLSVPARSGFTC